MPDEALKALLEDDEVPATEAERWAKLYREQSRIIDKIHTDRFIGAIVIVILVGAALIFGADYFEERSNNQAIADLVAAQEVERVERSIVTCTEDNKGRVSDQEQTFALVANPQSLEDAVEQGRIEQALDFFRPLRPLRICTAGAIEAYFDSQGAEGIVEIAWPDHVEAFLAEFGPEILDPPPPPPTTTTPTTTGEGV